MQPTRTRLTTEVVLRAALALVDREGLDALTMRQLGREVGVEAMSLYNHVRDKEDLLDGIVGLLAAEVGVPPEEHGDWAERIAEVVRRYRRLSRSHPNAFPLIALRPLRTPAARQPVEEALAVATRAGLTPADARQMFRVLSSYANGFALNELSGGFAWPTRGTAPPRNLDAEFEDGLRLIIDGFQRRLRAGRRRSGAATPPSPIRRSRGR